MDANNPRILYAALWEHGRLPWKVISGGPGSGLYKSTDGGETWEKLKDGLPKEMGKMSIAVCPSNSEKVYALIESDSEKEAGGLFVSTNAGKSWSRVTNDHRLVQRAWYYIELFPDPLDENTLYVLSAPALRSKDGGKTWETLSGTHGDYHDLWINPKNSKNMVIANDGGAAITFNSGKSWSTQSNMPTAQLYRINVDNQFPYRIYAGQQDNSSVSIAHRELGEFNLKKVLDALVDIAKIEQGIRYMGKAWTMMLSPDKPKVDAIKRKLEKERQEKLAKGEKVEEEKTIEQVEDEAAAMNKGDEGDDGED